MRGVTWTANTPLSNDVDRERVTIAGYTPATKERVMLERNVVGPHYHEVLGIPMVSGRGFEPAQAMHSIIEAARSANPAVPVFGAATMSERLRAVLAPQLVGAWLLGVFGVLALTLAAVGIYGIVAFAVSQRTREIGIRMALGAQSNSVLGLVMRGNIGFVALGIPIGLAIGVGLARAMARFLYGVGATDVLTFVGTSFVIRWSE